MNTKQTGATRGRDGDLDDKFKTPSMTKGPWANVAPRPMRKHHPNHRRVKIHRSYTVEEITRLFGNHKNTVRAWIKAGLPTSDEKRPILILGSDLAAFLRDRRASKKQPCGPCEIYCVRCRAPQFPAADMAEYQTITEQLGNLMAICPACTSMMYRRVNSAQLGQLRRKIEITFPQALQRVSESSQSSVNSDLKEGTRP